MWVSTDSDGRVHVNTETGTSGKDSMGITSTSAWDSTLSTISDPEEGSSEGFTAGTADCSSVGLADYILA